MVFCTIWAGRNNFSDNNKKWSGYVNQIGRAIEYCEGTIHFFSSSEILSHSQNCLWLIEVKEDNVNALMQELKHLRKFYEAEEIMVMSGELVGL